MSTPVYYPETDFINADGTMTILRCGSCQGRLRVRPASAAGYTHADGPQCTQYPQAVPSRIAIPLEKAGS